MLLTHAHSKSSTSTFDLIEEAANRLVKASAKPDSDTASFLMHKMDVEARTLKKDRLVSGLTKQLRAELEGKGLECALYRFHKDHVFGGCTLVVSNLTENNHPVNGRVFIHVRRNGKSGSVLCSMKYKSPYKRTKQYTSLNTKHVDQIWAMIENLGYDTPEKGVELDIQSFIEHEQELGSAKCVDLKKGASYGVANTIRKRLMASFNKTQVVEVNSRYTVVAQDPK